MISLVLLAVCIWIGFLIWQDRARERQFDEGLDKMREVFDENPDFLIDDEPTDWYNVCELCDDALYEGEARVVFPNEEDLVVICEYCLNPALKG